MSVYEDLRPILEKATLDERRLLREILDPETSKDLEPGTEKNWFSPEDIVEQLRQKYFFDYVFKEESEVNYVDIVADVAKKHDIKIAGLTLEDLEVQIILHYWEKTWENMRPDERAKMLETLEEEAKKYGMGQIFAGAGGVGIFAALLAGRFSGFSVYLLATGALKGMSSVLGLTLPFAAYMGVSRGVSLFLGPPGWIAAIGLTAMAISKGKYKKLTAFVMCIAALKRKYRGELPELF